MSLILFQGSLHTLQQIVWKFPSKITLGKRPTHYHHQRPDQAPEKTITYLSATHRLWLCNLPTFVMKVVKSTTCGSFQDGFLTDGSISEKSQQESHCHSKSCACSPPSWCCCEEQHCVYTILGLLSPFLEVCSGDSETRVLLIAILLNSQKECYFGAFCQ